MQQQSLETTLSPPGLVLVGLCVKVCGFSVVTEVFLDFQQVVQLYWGVEEGSSFAYSILVV